MPGYASVSILARTCQRGCFVLGYASVAFSSSVSWPHSSTAILQPTDPVMEPTDSIAHTTSYLVQGQQAEAKQRR